jgi:sialate O-acetylesterase
MVLQRDSATTLVWGVADAGVNVSTAFRGAAVTVTTGADGVWRLPLPATPASGPYDLSFTSTTGGSVALHDVLFGDVYLCGG